MRNCLLIIILGLTACKSDMKEYRSWPHYKGSPESIHYSSLVEIDTSNVRELEVAWQYRTGDADTVHHSQIQCNPIIIDSVLYGTSPQMKLFALDAATGKERWVFNPFDSLASDKTMFFILNNSRGISYWSDGQDDSRIFYTAGSQLFAINAQNGKPVQDFGTGGSIDLHEGLDRDVADLFITATSPGIVYKDLIIMGSRVDEGAAAAPGHIRAYDVRTGKRKWIFHTIPHPGEDGFDSWDDSTAYKFIGGANAWSGFSLDERRGIVFAVTGSASYDFYGGKRLGDNNFADCLLALDANTGKRLWHFQTLHHDVWDRDPSSPPALVTIKKNGKAVDAVAMTTKTGFIFVFERETGKPVYDIEEKPVPTISELRGEKLSPTQPIPTWPESFVRQLFTEKDINPLLSPESVEEVKKRLASYKNDHMFNPPSLQGTVILPGLDGGAEWGGPSYDPESGVLYVNANEMAWVIQAVDISKEQPKKETFDKAGQRLYNSHCMSCHGPDLKGSGNIPTIEDLATRYSVKDFNELIQAGRRMMPAFKQLNENEREAIATYVLKIRGNRDKTFIGTPEREEYKLPYSITGYNKFLSKEGYPALAPPWGTLNAVDLNTGKYLWKKILGHDTAFKEARAPTGTENYGASVVTKGGLLFIGATKDGKLRAFNKRNGELLWQTSLPYPAFATPAIYEVNGRQYIVIACGGGKMGTPSGDTYIAFALPEEKERAGRR